MLAVPVRRCSTKDKDQRPERQQLVMDGWAKREGVGLVSPETDDGVSADKTNPFQREGFMRALGRADELAQKTGEPVALLFDKVDRFTRRDLDETGWAKTEIRLRTDGRVRVWFCEVGGLAEQETALARLIVGFKAESSREENTKRATQIREGMQLSAKTGRTKKGAVIGRPRKPVSDREWERVLELQGLGYGFERIAVVLTDERTAHCRTDKAKCRKLAVSDWTLRQEAKRRSARGNQSPEETGAESRAEPPRGSDIFSSEPAAGTGGEP